MRIVDRSFAAYESGVARARKGSAAVDHVWRAKERFAEVLGSRLAAAISYYGFFAAFSLAVVTYSILGRVLDTADGGFIGTVNNYLDDSMRWVKDTAAQVGSGQVTTVGLIGLFLTGMGWMDALRSSTRAVWRLEQHPGNWLVRRLLDLGLLIALGILLGLSLATAGAIDGILTWMAGPTTGAIGQTVLRSSGPILELMVNLILAAALIAAVPWLRLSPRRLLPATVVVGVGIQLLNTVGKVYITGIEARPAYQLVSGAAGLLVYLYLLNQLIVIGSALAATSSKGTAVDLSARRSDQREVKPSTASASRAAATATSRDDGHRTTTDP
jgi:membrane protein